MKYPKKYKGEKTLLKLPVKTGSIWHVHKLFKDGTTEKTGAASYEKEAHCWRPCLAHNNRVGYKGKEVNKLIKKFYNVKENKKEKKQKKEKKSKKNKS